MMLLEREREFLEWLEERFEALMAAEAPGGGSRVGFEPRNGRISRLVEAGGVSRDQAEAQSVALQAEFADEAEAKRWADARLGDTLARFHELFGPDAMGFTSIFEIVR